MHHDVTLIDLTYLLIAAESAKIWRTGQENLSGRSTSQTSMDIGDTRSPEKSSLPNGKGLALVKPFDRIVKRKAESEIVQKSLFVFTAKRGGIGYEAALTT